MKRFLIMFLFLGINQAEAQWCHSINCDNYGLTTCTTWFLGEAVSCYDKTTSSWSTIYCPGQLQPQPEDSHCQESDCGSGKTLNPSSSTCCDANYLCCAGDPCSEDYCCITATTTTTTTTTTLPPTTTTLCTCSNESVVCQGTSFNDSCGNPTCTGTLVGSCDGSSTCVGQTATGNCGLTCPGTKTTGSCATTTSTTSTTTTTTLPPTTTTLGPTTTLHNPNNPAIPVKNVDCSNPTPYEAQFCNLSCEANGCIKLKYCFYGYSAPNTPNSPCNSTTGMGYITQFIKVICDIGDTRCLATTTTSSTTTTTTLSP